MSSIIDKFKASKGCLELFALEGKKTALDLLASNPLCGFTLAQNHIFIKPTIHWPLAVARDLVGKPEREILGRLGFQPATEAIAKLGRKCLPESLTVERCLHLRRIVAESEIRSALAHLPRINAGVIGLVSTRALRQCVTQRLLLAVADSADELTHQPTADLLRDTVELHYSLLRRTNRLPRFVNRQRIREEHDHLVAEVARHGTYRYRRQIFPPPPIPEVAEAGKEVRYVRTSEGLQTLGREQHNCVGSYANRAMKGQVFVYRTCVQGEVGTLALTRDYHQRLQISEFKGTCNRQPSPMAEFAVRRWFEAGCAGHRAPTENSRRRNRPLPPVPLSGGASGGVEVSPVPDQQALFGYLGNWTAVDFYTQKAEREPMYRVVTPQGAYLAVIHQHRGAYRLKEVRRADGAPVRGELLVEVNNWLGKIQGRYR